MTIAMCGLDHDPEEGDTEVSWATGSLKEEQLASALRGKCTVAFPSTAWEKTHSAGACAGFHPYSRPPGRDSALHNKPSHGAEALVDREAGRDDAHRVRPQSQAQNRSRRNEETQEDAGGSQRGADESGGTRAREPDAGYDGHGRQETPRRPLVRSAVVVSGNVKHAMGDYRRGLEG